MGSVDVQQLACRLPDGRELFADVSFKVGDGEHVALVGANGVGKTTLLNQIAAGGKPAEGAINASGGAATVLAPHVMLFVTKDCHVASIVAMHRVMVVLASRALCLLQYNVGVAEPK